MGWASSGGCVCQGSLDQPVIRADATFAASLRPGRPVSVNPALLLNLFADIILYHHDSTPAVPAMPLAAGPAGNHSAPSTSFFANRTRWFFCVRSWPGGIRSPANGFVLPVAVPLLTSKYHVLPGTICRGLVREPEFTGATGPYKTPTDPRACCSPLDNRSNMRRLFAFSKWAKTITGT